ncbi:hypothetical protein Pfo_010794 [Paulownia fortunei]|nr:hypothetical protein Pfo_010794 [Paulownia fortunei]
MRKCSQCGKTGHNSRTCRSLARNENGQSMKLFGVELVSVPSSDDGFGFRKSFSAPELLSSEDDNSDKLLKNGYFSNALIGTTQGHRKKGVPWSEEEHRLFLLGLEKLGKGDWRGISRNFVTTRTSTQVASHAQKYFLRQNNANKNKHRPTLHSMVGRNEAQVEQVHRNESSISFGMFSTTDCIFSKKKPIPPPFTVAEIPYCRLFNNISATQNCSPSLELSLAAPQPPVWIHRRPVVFFKKQSVI